MDEKHLQEPALTGPAALLRPLASLRLTLAVFVFLAAGVLGAYLSAARTMPFLVAVLALLAINLLAAVASNRRFRRQRPLLWFHLALLVLVVLVAVGRLTYLKGQVEVLEGEAFDGQPVAVEAGPWHRGRLDQVRFTNLGFRIDYGPGQMRLRTENRVAWNDAAGTRHEAAIGDHHPLVIDGYRFYTTWNKGFALVFAWQPAGRPAVAGSVHLPSYPANALKQAQQWTLPGLDEPLWAMLQFDGELIPLDSAGQFRLPETHSVILRHGARRWELAPPGGSGPASVDLPEGRLTYLGLRTWMGYQVAYDPTLPWLLAAAVAAILALGWHFWRKFAARSWNP